LNANKRGIVNKLQYAFTGPWLVTANLKDAFHEIVHCDNAKKTEKKHASDLSPYPAKLIPFQLVDGADTHYGKLYKPISAHTFNEAGIKGFSPIQPFQVITNFAITDWCAAFDCPSLSELNDQFPPFPRAKYNKFQQYLHGHSTLEYQNHFSYKKYQLLCCPYDECCDHYH
jgi:hypothetical protein